MTNLEDYLSTDFHEEKRILGYIDGLINGAVSLFLNNKCGKKSDNIKYSIWESYITSTKKKASSSTLGDVSFSTSAMVYHSLMMFSGHINESVLNPLGVTKSGKPPKLSQKSKESLENLEGELESFLEACNKEDGTVSETFGKKDIFTLAWLGELINVDKKTKDNYIQIGTASKEKIKFLNDQRVDEVFECDDEKLKAEKNYLIFLRLLQLHKIFEGNNVTEDKLKMFFENRLHDHLSYFSIPDTRFDPAELIFCMEGILTIDPTGLERSIVNRVFSVLEQAQDQSIYFRPTTPILSNKKGLVLYSSNADGMNSLLRCCSLLDGGKAYDTYGSKYMGIFMRYYKWLEARKVNNKNDSCGWHSVHGNDPQLIQLWVTSQVLHFLLAFRKLLDDHIANTTLTLSKFDLKIGDELEDVDTWNKAIEKYEPLKDLENEIEVDENKRGKHQVYKWIGVDFAGWFNKEEPKNFSMLLYGPPGTGKSTVAENLAAALKFKMITITVSDFLHGGENELENRAKTVFEVLEAQKEAVILFDEIDQLLLDRDSKLYKDQTSEVFKMIVPGMLTKINDLRKRKRVIFIIATNYACNIDSAIKRTGRIDQKYLLLPPNKARRMEILSERLGFKSEDGNEVKEKREELRVFNKDEDDIAKFSLFLSYSDLKAVVESVDRTKNKYVKYKEELKGGLKDFSPTINLNAYMNKEILDDTNIKEGLALLYLRGEVDLTKVNSSVLLKFCENIGEYFEKQGVDIENIKEDLEKIAGVSVLRKVWEKVSEDEFVKNIKYSYKEAKKAKKKRNDENLGLP